MRKFQDKGMEEQTYPISQDPSSGTAGCPTKNIFDNYLGLSLGEKMKNNKMTYVFNCHIF